MDASYHLNQIDIYNLEFSSFNHQIVKSIGLFKEAMEDINTRLNTLEGASNATLQSEIELLRAAINTVQDDLAFEASARTQEIITLNEKIDGCSWCAEGKLGAKP